MILLLILADVPPFTATDGKTWRLRKGDLVSVNGGLPYRMAKILITREAARWVVPL